MHKKKTSRFNLNQRGVSIVEALVAAAIIASTVVLVVQFNSTAPVRNISMTRTCESYAQSIVNAVQEETYYREIVSFIPTDATGRSATSFVASGTSRAITNPALPWSGAAPGYIISQVPTTSTSGIPLQNFQLINGSLRSLSAIFNSTSNVRCGFGDYPDLTSIAPPPDLVPLGVNAKLKLRPYDKATGGDVADCTLPIDFAPEEVSNDQKASVFAPNSASITPPAGFEEYSTSVASQPPLLSGPIANRGVGNKFLGMEMTVRVTYTPVGQPQESCQVTQKFEYPRDRTPPEKPSISVISNNTGVDLSSVPTCSDTVNPSATIRIQGPAATELGSQFLCRDLSWEKNWDPPAGPNFTPTPPCMTGTPSSSIDAVIRPYPETAALQSFGARQDRWVPCDKLQQCGVNPTVSYNKATQPNTDLTTPHMLTLSYTGLPYGCVMNAEVMTVDTAGNSSIAGSDANRVFLENSAAGILFENEIHQKTCGTFCDPATIPNYNTYAFASNFAGGYYRCNGACCVGPGCTPYY